ncbi:hypothetical protein J3U99_20015 [Brucella pituitosa]|nr:hypothetical protein [Brucella pituitosa]
MLPTRHCMTGGPSYVVGWFISPTTARNIYPFAIPSRLAEVGIELSVGSVGVSYDNALAETINGRY